MTASRTPSVVFVANGPPGSAAAVRAEQIAGVTAGRATVLYRRGARTRSVRDGAAAARALRPDLVYCVDLAVVPVAVALCGGRHAVLVVDTGDHPSAFLRHVGAGRSAVAAARLMEEVVYRRAGAVVVRSHHHAAVVRGLGVRRAEVIRDGVDLATVQPCADEELRARLGLNGVLTVGIAGCFTWYDHLGGGLGWELVQALALLPDVAVHGVLIGDGPGLSRLRVLAAELGVAERLHVLGRVPYDEYARYVGLIDVCLLTQTNDPSSWIRTTGKLPAYLAAGRYILASAVGTAAEVLPDSMLVPYAGRWDPEYPERLARRIRTLAGNPAMLAHGAALREQALAFDYRTVAASAAGLIAELAGAA